MTTLPNLIANHIQQCWPHISRAKADKWAQAYLTEIVRQIGPHLARRITYSQNSHYHLLTDYQFSIKDARRNLGQVRVISDQRAAQWLFTAMMNNNIGGLLTIMTKGNNLNHRLSTVMIHDRLCDHIIDHELQAREVWPDDFSGVKQWIPIDTENLKNYAETLAYHCSKAEQRGEIKLANHDKINLAQCSAILRLSEQVVALAAWPEPALPVYEEQGRYGRRYHSSINLQTARREVRHAALGECWEYDLNSATFAVKLWLASEALGPGFSGKFTYTKEYVELKQQHRRRLAKLIHAYPEGEKLIKQCINAIGFGATHRERGWKENGQWRNPAISDIILNKEDRARVLADPWLTAFIHEQGELNRCLYDYYWPQYEAELAQDYPEFTKGRNRYRQFVCWLFQSLETRIMDQVCEYLGDAVLLRVHDAVYCSEPQNLVDLREFLSEITGGWLKIDQTYHFGNNPRPEPQWQRDKEELKWFRAHGGQGDLRHNLPPRYVPPAAIHNDDYAYDGALSSGASGLFSGSRESLDLEFDEE